MPTYDSAITPPYPTLLSKWPAPALVRDVDASLFRWLKETFDLDLRGLSTEELVFVLRARPGFDRGAAAVLTHIEGIRTSIRCLQYGGFALVLAQFEDACRGKDPEGAMRSLHEAFGGVPALADGRSFLAIPCPSGEWAVSDGVRLQRLWGSPFAEPCFPLS